MPSSTLRLVTVPASDIYEPREAQFTLSRHDSIVGSMEHEGKFVLTVERAVLPRPAVDPLRRFRVAINTAELCPGESLVAQASMGRHVVFLLELPIS